MSKISKNYKKGKLINSMCDIVDLSLEGKSVYVLRWGRTSPAAFLVSWPVRLLNKWVKQGCFYTIIKIEDNE